jgi:hypothetical protein
LGITAAAFDHANHINAAASANLDNSPRVVSDLGKINLKKRIGQFFSTYFLEERDLSWEPLDMLVLLR